MGTQTQALMQVLQSCQQPPIQPSNHTVSQPHTQLATQPDRQPGSQPASQLASQPASHPTTQPTRQEYTETASLPTCHVLYVIYLLFIVCLVVHVAFSSSTHRSMRLYAYLHSRSTYISAHLFTYPPICPSMYQPILPYVGLSTSPYVCLNLILLSIPLSICLSARLPPPQPSNHPFSCKPIYLHFYIFAYPPSYSSVCMPIYFSKYVSILHIFVYMSIYIYMLAIHNISAHLSSCVCAYVVRLLDCISI